jgi:tetratricopeptide (TPR) repeat protein
MTPTDLDAQRRIQEKWVEIESQDYWAILGLREGATDDQIKSAYMDLARSWHVDNFSSFNLGAAATTLTDVFQRIAEAYEVLSDPAKRGNWEAGLALQAAGVNTDVGALLDAESNFARARTLLERGEMKAAAKLFAEVYEVNPSNAEWRAHHMYCAWWVNRDVKEAPSVAADLAKINKEVEHLADATYFAGRLYLEAGDLANARKMFRRVLNQQKNHGMTHRDMRLLTRKEEEAQKKKGFFAKLFGK